MTKPITYPISRNQMQTYSAAGKDFLAFNEFVNVVQVFRDRYLAPDYVVDFIQDIGVEYNFWTRHSVSTYHRHLFPADLEDAVTISFEIPELTKNASFQIGAKIYDDGGLYFEHQQEVVVERFVNGRFVLSGWRKIPTVREFLLSQQTET